MHSITQEILDLVSWFEEREYTRDAVLHAFDTVIWFIDHNSKIHTKSN